jgi:hypothetical protein
MAEMLFESLIFYFSFGEKKGGKEVKGGVGGGEGTHQISRR